MTTPEDAAIVQPTTWSASEDEDKAIEALSGFIRAMADLLHRAEDARYTEPSGGHVIDAVPSQHNDTHLEEEVIRR